MNRLFSTIFVLFGVLSELSRDDDSIERYSSLKSHFVILVVVKLAIEVHKVENPLTTQNFRLTTISFYFHANFRCAIKRAVGSVSTAACGDAVPIFVVSVNLHETALGSAKPQRFTYGCLGVSRKDDLSVFVCLAIVIYCRFLIRVDLSIGGIINGYDCGYPHSVIIILTEKISRYFFY